MPKKRNPRPLTQARVQELLSYDPDTGKLVWRVFRGRTARPGEVAGCVHKQGYIAIEIDGAGYLAHRVAWLYMTGVLPTREIDHRDLDKANNRWSNLREADPSQNCANRPARADSKSGFKGVRQRKNRRITGARGGKNKWRAIITVNGVRHELGNFDTAEQAQAAYARAAREHHGDFARS